MDKLYELGDLLLINLLDVEEILVNYEIVMETEDIDVIIDLSGNITEEEESKVILTNKEYNDYIDQIILSLLGNSVETQQLNTQLREEQLLSSTWMDLILEYPNYYVNYYVDNIHEEVNRGIDIVNKILSYIREEQRIRLLKSRKRLYFAKLLHERLAPEYIDQFDPRMMEEILERI